MQTLKEYFYGLFTLIIAFSYSIFFIAQVSLGISETGAVFQIYSGMIAMMAFVIFAFYQSRIKFGNGIYILFTITIVTVAFFATRLHYPYVNDRYQSYFLSMGVRFIPPVLMGAVLLAENRSLERIEKALLPFMLFYTTVLVYVVFSVSVTALKSNMLVYNGSGLNYQTISYFSAYALGMNLYLITHKYYNRWMLGLLGGLALIQFYISMSTGSRGAFVLAIIFVVYLGRKIFRKLTIGKMILGLLVLTSVVMLIWSDTRLQYGFSRIFSFWSNSNAIQNDGRWIRWDLAWDAFVRSPIWGNGLGSVFYEVGFYSHNLFTDMLCEGGVLLVGLFISILFVSFRKITRYIQGDSRHEIFIIIFLCSFVMLCFSGYYLSESGLWLSISYLLQKKQKDEIY